MPTPLPQGPTTRQQLMSPADYERIKSAILTLVAVDLNYYKPHQMVRRLTGFVERHRASSVAEFCKRLEADAALRNALKDFLTINVTEFFRDTLQFELLEKQVLPEILRQSPSPRIWSAGCSRGAEAYSVAMVLEDLRPGSRYHIRGTDLDREVVRIAKAGGPYEDPDLRSASPRRLMTYFTKTPTGRIVKPEIKAHTEFKEGNLLTDRFDSGFDLVMCRNVVIYFSDPAKEDLNRRFSASLRPGGFLFIGGTETIMDPKAFGFERASSCFYRKTNREAQKAAA